MMRKLELFVGNIDRLPHRVYLIMIPSHKYLLNPIYIKKTHWGLRRAKSCLSACRFLKVIRFEGL